VQNNEFQEYVWQKGKELYRQMPWREDTRPYYVLVSELMLQQTQVSRVIPKFISFITRFPDIETLARAPLADVVMQWQGLGYNRRAKYLHDAAKIVMKDFSGKFPSDGAALQRLPGVGVNTAGAIGAYSYNQPSLFIETNIRTVYIHHFFHDDFSVDDKQIILKLEKTIDREHAREFYWALMDYGNLLKTSGVKNIRQSRQYKKQAPLAGSLRQMRGRIIRALSETAIISEGELRQLVSADKRFDPAIAALIAEGLIGNSKGKFHLTK
jgi:A/G-specific adenine glycosylase